MGAAKGTVPWNAGTSAGWTDKRGYRWVYVTVNGQRVARRENRKVMEDHLGRRLEPWGIVHHTRVIHPIVPPVSRISPGRIKSMQWA